MNTQEKTNKKASETPEGIAAVARINKRQQERNRYTNISEADVRREIKKGSGSQNVETKRSLFTGEEIPKWSLREHKPKGEREPELRHNVERFKDAGYKIVETEREPETRITQPENWEDLSEAEQDAWMKENASAPETHDYGSGYPYNDYDKVIQQRNELLAALRKADLIAADIDCLSGTTAEGRKAQGYGARLHALVTAAIARAEKGAGQ